MIKSFHLFKLWESNTTNMLLENAQLKKFPQFKGKNLLYRIESLYYSVKMLKTNKLDLRQTVHFADKTKIPHWAKNVVKAELSDTFKADGLSFTRDSEFWASNKNKVQIIWDKDLLTQRGYSFKPYHYGANILTDEYYNKHIGNESEEVLITPLKEVIPYILAIRLVYHINSYEIKTNILKKSKNDQSYNNKFDDLIELLELCKSNTILLLDKTYNEISIDSIMNVDSSIYRLKTQMNERLPQDLQKTLPGTEEKLDKISKKWTGKDLLRYDISLSIKEEHYLFLKNNLDISDYKTIYKNGELDKIYDVMIQSSNKNYLNTKQYLLNVVKTYLVTNIGLNKFLDLLNQWQNKFINSEITKTELIDSVRNFILSK
jgi:hypothetical protein